MKCFGSALALTFLAVPVAAQTWTLSINSGAPVNFPVPTEAIYDGGSVTANAPLAFTVQGTGGIAYRAATVSIRSNSATMGSGKPIADLQWRRSDLGVWTAMTTVNALVETRNMFIFFGAQSWSNSIVFRTLLNWANDGPGTYNPTLVVTLTIAAP